MAAQRAVPMDEAPDCANERFKGRFQSIFWTSIELPPEVVIPPPPQQIARPATPVMAAADIADAITIAPTTFEMNPVDELPPPPSLEQVVVLGDAPTFTPFTVAPSILNREEIIDAMRAEYPPLLRDAGIGGEVRLDPSRARASIETSGHKQLDDAALAVANLYRFSPALNRDEKVPVWVSFPIQFKVVH